MDAEINSLIENDTFEIDKLPQGKTSVGGRWVYAIKSGPEDVDKS